jgi:zinc protease
MKYSRKKLDNGLITIFVPIKHMSIVTTGFFVNAGSRNETEENNGIAHFLEHMMFKGTENRTHQKMFDELDYMGATYNAATTTQYTYYYIYGHMDDTKKILDIMLDIYINPIFETKEINKERKVIIEEMRMVSDSPMMKLYSEAHRKIFIETSLARDIIGTRETIMDLKKKDFIEFRKSSYRPDNTVFVMVGNFNPVPIYKMLDKSLSGIVNPSETIKTYLDEKTTIINNMNKQTEPYVFVKKNKLLQQVYMMLGFPLFELYKTKHNEIDILSQLLTAGFSSRLNRALRSDKGITYSVSSYPVTYLDSGIFLIQMVVHPDEYLNGLKILLKELKKTKEKNISKEEHQKIINIIKNEEIYSMTDPVDILTHFGLNFLSDEKFKPNPKQDILELKNTTRDSIKKTAIQIFDRDKINLFLYGNLDETDYNFMNL